MRTTIPPTHGADSFCIICTQPVKEKRTGEYFRMTKRGPYLGTKRDCRHSDFLSPDLSHLHTCFPSSPSKTRCTDITVPLWQDRGIRDFSTGPGLRDVTVRKMAGAAFNWNPRSTEHLCLACSLPGVLDSTPTWGPVSLHHVQTQAAATAPALSKRCSLHGDKHLFYRRGQVRGQLMFFMSPPPRNPNSPPTPPPCCFPF